MAKKTLSVNKRLSLLDRKIQQLRDEFKRENLKLWETLCLRNRDVENLKDRWRVLEHMVTKLLPKVE